MKIKWVYNLMKIIFQQTQHGIN